MKMCKEESHVLTKVINPPPPRTSQSMPKCNNFFFGSFPADWLTSRDSLVEIKSCAWSAMKEALKRNIVVNADLSVQKIKSSSKQHVCLSKYTPPQKHFYSWTGSSPDIKMQMSSYACEYMLVLYEQVHVCEPQLVCHYAYVCMCVCVCGLSAWMNSRS